MMYHAACKVEFQPFKRLYSQLTFFNFLLLECLRKDVFKNVPAFRITRHVSDTYVEVWELGYIFTHPPEDEKRKKM